MNNGMTYEQYLAEYGSLTYTFKGCSMNPMLREGRDIFTVKAKTFERCRKYDVVLYRSPRGRYVLHRIVKVRDEDYVIIGDNCVTKEYGIRDEDIIGALTEFVHNGKACSVRDFRYLCYVHLWCDFLCIRIGLLKLRALAGRIKRRLKG